MPQHAPPGGRRGNTKRSRMLEAHQHRMRTSPPAETSRGAPSSATATNASWSTEMLEPLARRALRRSAAVS
eukprot:6918872-Prymnesium_polylepis.2